MLRKQENSNTEKIIDFVTFHENQDVVAKILTSRCNLIIIPKEIIKLISIVDTGKKCI